MNEKTNLGVAFATVLTIVTALPLLANLASGPGSAPQHQSPNKTSARHFQNRLQIRMDLP